MVLHGQPAVVRVRRVMRQDVSTIWMWPVIWAVKAPTVKWGLAYLTEVASHPVVIPSMVEGSGIENRGSRWTYQCVYE